MAIIYLATNTFNGKRYVGFTSNTLQRRVWQHKNDAIRTDRPSKTAFSKAIRKYGIDGFSFSILIESQDSDHLLRIEEPRLIKELGTNVKDGGYNICSGGKGRIGAAPWNKGIPRDAATREKIRQKAIGRKQSSQTVDKRVLKIKGMKRSESTKHKMSSSWLITFPDQTTQTVINLRQFCKTHSLTLSCMINVANVSRVHHKQFRCTRLSNGPQSRRN